MQQLQIFLYETTDSGTGEWIKSAGQEDPVELDSSLKLQNGDVGVEYEGDVWQFPVKELLIILAVMAVALMIAVIKPVQEMKQCSVLEMEKRDYATNFGKTMVSRERTEKMRWRYANQNRKS